MWQCVWMLQWLNENGTLQATNVTLTDSNAFLEAELARRDAEAAALRAQLQQGGGSGEITGGSGGSAGGGAEPYAAMKEQLQRDFGEKVGTVVLRSHGCPNRVLPLSCMGLTRGMLLR